MAVDIVGCTLIGYFSFSRTPQLDLSELTERDYYFSIIFRVK